MNERMNEWMNTIIGLYLAVAHNRLQLQCTEGICCTCNELKYFGHAIDVNEIPLT